ncbi:MAG: PEP-CTERM sorting domain-containing protein [Akkermansiaceae bacterium]
MKTSLIVLSSVVCFTATASAANIVLVTDFEATTDVPLINFLTNAGHVVTATNQRYRSLDATKIAELDAADLVFVSRSTDSTSYANNAAEVAQWDSVSSPILLGSAFLIRDSRWQWVNSSSLGSYGGDITAPTVGAASHPIYDGLTPSSGSGFVPGNSKYLFTTSGVDVETGGANLAGTGTLIGVRNNASFQYVLAAEFAAGSTTGSGNTLAGDRFFLTQPVTFSNHNANGLLMLENTVDYLTVPEPSSVTMLLLGAAGFFSRRRKA